MCRKWKLLHLASNSALTKVTALALASKLFLDLRHEEACHVTLQSPTMLLAIVSHHL